MNLDWSLDELYTSFESSEYKSDSEKLKTEIYSYIEWADRNLEQCDESIADKVGKIEAFIEIQLRIAKLATTLSAYSGLVSSIDAKNEVAIKELDKIEELYSETALPNASFVQWIKNVNLDELPQTELIKEHEYLLRSRKKIGQYTLSKSEEAVFSKLRNTGSSAWEKLQRYLTSTLLVDITIDGEEKKLPLPAVRNMAYEKDASLRKNAYDAELKSYEKIADSVAFSLNGIKGEVLSETKLRGYKSPLEMTLLNSRMDEAVLNPMIEAMKESLPTFTKYFKKKASMLGHNGSLPFYDIFAPVGETDLRFTYEEATDYIIKNFSGFSQKLGDFTAHAVKNRWIDVLPKEGKSGGAFCYNLNPIRASRVMTNFTGSFNDMTTIAHELGHAYHGACLDDESLLNADYPMPIAETASTFCEILVMKAALETAPDNEKVVILENYISGCAQVIVDILSRYIFETSVFENRKDGSLSTDELCNLMLAAQKEAYLDGLDHNYLHKYMWVCKSHYYSASYNFYNFPYAFGQLFATGLYSRYLTDTDSFVKEYDKLLSVTGKMDLADVAATVGVDIRSIDFWRSSLKVIEEDINKFIAL